MRETSSRGWQRWRVAVNKSATPAAVIDRLARLPGPTPVPEGAAVEAKGPDGIRHELVARIRQQIADGTYDTEEKWLLAEEALLRRVEGCA
jgi:hypothetical protein